jgi:hypothetical protein
LCQMESVNCFPSFTLSITVSNKKLRGMITAFSLADFKKMYQETVIKIAIQRAQKDFLFIHYY